MTDLVLHELAPSPNNLKVRMALGFKGIPYERAPIQPGDRTSILAVSGQPRTPVLVHGETVIFDSNGINRYLEANVKREPRLFSEEYAEFGEIEQWELFARTRLGEPIGALFRMAASDAVDPAGVAEANARFHDLTGELEGALEDTGFLVGGRTTNADLAVSCLANLGMLTEEHAAASPILGFFRDRLALGDGRERTRAWIERHVAYDR
jgi:glutathione S-transferase